MIIKKLCFFLPFLVLSSFALSQVKLSPPLAKNFHFEAGKTKLSVTVKDSEVFKRKFKDRIRVHVHAIPSNCFEITGLDKSVLNDLTKDSNVVFIDHHQKPVEESSLDYTSPSFNRITKAQMAFPQLTGSNLNIAIKELRFDTTDIDIKNRTFLTSLTALAGSQHATTMATLIGGGGNSSWRAKGILTKSHLTSSDYNNLPPDDISFFNTNNIYLQNHSYGIEIQNYYGNEANAYDQQVYQNPKLLHVFSAGNSGKLQPASGTYQGMTFANLTGNFKQAKNVLVVNAVDSTLLINILNSRGPAFDGRVKPELTAFGQGGTSEASALASGISGLIQEKYKLTNGQLPDASMVKAILIASANDIGPAGIDYLYGYGSIDAYKALKLVELSQTTSVNMTGATVSVPITVPSSVSEMKIAAVWSDPEAAVNVNNVLVNDIDTWLDDGTSITLPWVLNPYPKSDSLLALPKRKTDHLNNIEYITVSNPHSGSYQLYLTSGALTNSSQVVSVAYWMETQNQFSWDYPDSTQIIEGGSKTLLTWGADKNQFGNLYLQLNPNLNPGTWQLVKSNIDLNSSYYWHCPDTLAKAKLKMVVGGNDFITDEFMISPMLKIASAFNCTDSIGIVWNSLKNSPSYKFFTMGSQYLAQVASTQDTLEVIANPIRKYYAVAPVLNGKTGLKSSTIDYTLQGTFCYLNIFTAERSSASQVKVNLSLSSWHDVDHVVIYKTVNGVQTIFKTETPSNIIELNYFDTSLTSGVMEYQAKIFFMNGTTVLSDPMEVLIEEKGKAIIYPNPVSSDSDLSIISEGSGLTFRIVDLLGHTLYEKQLQSFDDSVDVFGISPGIYIYQLLSGGVVRDSGRFMKY